MRLVMTAAFRGFPCGKRARWLGWSRLTDLAQLQNLNYAEKRQALIRVFLVRASTHSDNDGRLRRFLIVRFVTDSYARPGALLRRARASRENPPQATVHQSSPRQVPLHHSIFGRF